MLKWQLIVCLLKKDFNAYFPVLLKNDMEGGYEKTKSVIRISQCY